MFSTKIIVSLMALVTPFAVAAEEDRELTSYTPYSSGYGGSYGGSHGVGYGAGYGGGCGGGYSSKRGECLKKGYKAHQCAAHGYRNRNLKTVDTEFLANDHKQCMDIHYDMFLVVEGVHFAGLAVPLESSSCPSVVFHSSIADDKAVQKVVMIADQEEVATFDSDSTHHLGSRPFATIVKAFDNAPVGKDGAKFYDSITNNCVSLLRNMADPLDVSVDDTMIDFFTKQLLSTGDINLWDGIKNSPSLSLLVEGGKRMLKASNQEDLVRKLIKLYV